MRVIRHLAESHKVLMGSLPYQLPREGAASFLGKNLVTTRAILDANDLFAGADSVDLDGRFREVSRKLENIEGANTIPSFMLTEIEADYLAENMQFHYDELRTAAGLLVMARNIGRTANLMISSIAESFD